MSHLGAVRFVTQLVTSSTLAQRQNALDGIDVTPIVPYSEAYVSRVDGVYRWYPESTLVADGITVVRPFLVDAADPGRWLRLGPSGAPIAAQQLDWYIDAVTGSDQNDGATAATALASWDEFRRRVGPSPEFDADLTINILSDLAESLQGVHFHMFNGAIVRVLGTVLEVLYSGTFSAVTAESPAGQQRMEISDGSVGDYATYLGNRIRITSGAASGAMGFIVKRLAATDAATSKTGTIDPNTSPPEFFVTNLTPSGGDAYEIERLTSVGGLDLEVSRYGVSASFFDLSDSVVADLKVEPGDTTMSLRNDVGAAGWNVQRCWVDGSDSSFVQSHVLLGLDHIDCAGFGYSSSVELTDSCVFRSTFQDIFFFSFNSAASVSNSYFQDCECRIIFGSSFVATSCGFWDSPSDGLSIQTGGQSASATGLLWGDGNADAGIQTVAGFIVDYDVTTKPIVTGANDTQINNVVVSYAGIPAFDTAAGCGIVAKAP